MPRPWAASTGATSDAPEDISGMSERPGIQRGERPDGFHDLHVLAVARQVGAGDDDRGGRQPDPMKIHETAVIQAGMTMRVSFSPGRRRRARVCC
jgi:hypothetical protein